MSFSVQRHKDDRRRLGKFSWPLLALIDMVAERDWDRAASLASSIALDCHAECIKDELRLNKRELNRG